MFEKLLLQTAVVKQLNKVIGQTRAEAEEALERGDTKRPRGLGSVSLPPLKSKAQVVDDEAFAAHCATVDGATVAVSITGPMEEVLAVLDEHAPHLIGEKTYLPDWLIEQELKAAASGKPVPGVELVESAPSMRVTAQDAAMVEALEILAGTPLAIEGGR
ncbi:MAG: hypothetical protein Q4F65_14690 [Propionibacteriaceae bacterium]|nr:hypothetical protein [Propionibacteriaceae bacterium]